ncbi:unnamed protein product [Durusdinium trenchii]|uniref:Uncharacterized protein n=1 Tax=Durusdinium trenchii TaxID=1381693 RepID=A0ABP0P923_9DINO
MQKNACWHQLTNCFEVCEYSRDFATGPFQMSTFANPAHILWQERVDKERQLAKRQIIKHLGLSIRCQETPPLHDLHKCMSMPKGGVMRTPQIIASPGSKGRPKTGQVDLDERAPSLRSAEGLNEKCASSRSSLTGLTTASLRREVHQAVAAEVARIVEPLKEKLQTEQTARQRLEGMLRVAQGKEGP